MAPHTYGEVLARNLRAARSRLGIGQHNVAVRMRALGYTAWIRQTVGSTERGKRRPTAEEVFALALTLETSIAALMTATADDKEVTLPAGSVGFKSVEKLATGFNDRSVTWDGDVPVFGQPVTGWWGDGPGGRTQDEILDRSRRAED